MSLVDVFRRVTSEMPWYRTLLEENGVHVEQVVDDASFSRLCPILTKQNTFDRFPLNELAATTKLTDMATLLTSSGHGGRFSFGLSTRSQAATAARLIDDALDAAFNVRSRPTLAINCLPMGVGFSSECMTVATTSVREDMAAALVEKFGAFYEQIVLVADPLFLKRLTDYATERGVDWNRYRIHVVLGEEIFGENFREYIASRLARDLDRPANGYIMSSFGVGELGLHLCYETPATIAIRRAAWRNPGLAQELLGVNAGEALPTVLTFNAQRTFIEVVVPEARGYGRLTVSMLEPELPIPLLRYQPGDVARLLDANSVQAILQRHGLKVSGIPSNLIALQGRVREALPNGSHVSVYKDALYANHEIAKQITGAFRVVASENTLHVQLVRNPSPADGLDRQLRDAIPPAARPEKIVVWRYDEFPFGMTLDYERKFSYV